MVEGVFEYLSGTRYVETHESATFVTKHRTVIEGEMGSVDKHLYELVLLHFQRAAVEPYQE